MFTRLSILIFVITFSLTVQSQSSISPEFSIQSSTVKKLGHSNAISKLPATKATSKAKKDKLKKLSKVPDNFKGRRGKSMATNTELEHQGIDPIWQKGFAKQKKAPNEPLINMDGLNNNFGSPTDPSGDVSDKFYVQAINITEVAVYDLEGNLIQQFSMNTLWSQFNVSSEGDPIILYDENVERWIVTEFTFPANLLIAISDTDDPLGEYSAYSFSTPNFPDYPKYALTQDALVVTTNENGASVLHQYFIDLNGLYEGEDNVNMQRFLVSGSNNTEAGFYVTTPADWNGTRLPYDNKPITLAINDSSWGGGPDQDQIEIYTFDIDFDDQNNSTVTQTSVVTTPFDSYPCSESGNRFECVPQLGGGGLDAIPEVVMNVPHLRNFGTHESLVFNFITDVTDGSNRSGIRWVELRRSSSEEEWKLYQEGTFAPDDGLDRFMGSIAIDARGSIGLGYNVTSANSNVGVRYTGRNASDPLGVMTVDEVIVVEGSNSISSSSRFGDYSQISVSPKGDNTFWFTTEYAGTGNPTTKTRIVAFTLGKDTFDLSTQAILNPSSISSTLTATELVSSEVVNSGIADMFDFEVGLILEGNVIETMMVTDTLKEGDTIMINFTTPIDMSTIGSYNIGAFVNKDIDQNLLNDTLFTVIRKIPQLDGAITATVQETSCEEEVSSQININNLGETLITSALIEVSINGVITDSIEFFGSIPYDQLGRVDYDISGLLEGQNEVTYTIIDINGNGVDADISNNSTTISTEISPVGSFFTLVFLTDEYPEESTWELTAQGSLEVLASGEFDTELMESRQQVCIDLDECYVITVFDSAGDGICCGFGEGSFSIENSFGEVLVSNNGNFGGSTSEAFCPGERNCLLIADIVVENASAAGEPDGSILITASNGVAPYQYSIDGGLSFQSEPLFDGLLADTYDVLVVDADSICTYNNSVVVSNPTGVHDINGAEVSITILPNPTNGVFQVNIENLKLADHEINVLVYDLSGRLIQSRGIGKYNDIYTGTFSLFDYNNGIYFVRISHPTFNLLEKVVKY